MDLRELLDIIRTRWLTVALLVILGTAASAALARTSPTLYTARSELFVSANNNPTPATQYQQQLYILGKMVSYQELATSPDVLNPAINTLGLTISSSALAAEVTATNPPGTVLLSVQVVDGNAQRAADLASEIGRQLGIAIEQIESVKNSESVVKVITTKQATVPSSPTSPKTTIIVAIGFLAGLILGLGIAVLRHRFDTSLKTAAELHTLTGVIPLGVVRKKRRGSPLLATLDRKSAQAESFRTIRARLDFADGATTPRAIAITSATADEGRTSVACNLAAALAQTGNRVCLVEADLRSPGLDDLLGLHAVTGLADVLAGDGTLDLALTHWGTGRVDVLTAGAVRADPAEALSSPALRRVLDELCLDYDHVVIDTPPALEVADSMIVARHTGGAIVVARAGRTRSEQLAEVIETLHAARVRVLGTVLTGAAKDGVAAYSEKVDRVARAADSA